jgi:hypothetical protein
MIVVGRGRGRLRAGDELTGAGRGVCGAPKAAVSAFGGVRADEREADREELARSRSLRLPRNDHRAEPAPRCDYPESGPLARPGGGRGSAAGKTAITVGLAIRLLAPL